MDVDDLIAVFAFGIGFVQMYHEYMRSEEVDEKTKSSVMLGLIASILWLIYQSRKYGMNFTVAYTTASLILHIYILNKILIKENT